MAIFTDEFIEQCRNGVASAFDTGVGYLTNLFTGERSSFSEWYDEWSGILLAFGSGILATLSVQYIYNVFRKRPTTREPSTQAPLIEEPSNPNFLAGLRQEISDLRAQQDSLTHALCSFAPPENASPAQILNLICTNLNANRVGLQFLFEKLRQSNPEVMANIADPLIDPDVSPRSSSTI